MWVPAFICIFLAVVQYGAAQTSCTYCPMCDAIEGTLWLDLGASLKQPGRYYLTNLLTNTFDAKQVCSKISSNSHLAEFDTEDEFNYVANLIAQYMFATEHVHIGGRRNPRRSSQVISEIVTNKLLFVKWARFPPRQVTGTECVSLVLGDVIPFEVEMEAGSCVNQRARILCEVTDLN